ncbi:MAG: LON peptidase substrate-binding domain-containing protein [Bacteroidota bacterium]
MTDFIPLFPLKMVVFPGEQLNLHIFEPRYKQLIREVEQNGTTFGIPAFIDNKIMSLGTEIELLDIVKRYDDGKLDIKTQGIGLFRIDTYYEEAAGKLYAGADIERVEHQGEGDPALSRRILRYLNELFALLKINKKVPKTEDRFDSFEIAHHVGFSLEQEYEFLCQSSELERQDYMVSHLEQMIPVVREMERLRKRVQLNGHFKNVIPPRT